MAIVFVPPAPTSEIFRFAFLYIMNNLLPAAIVQQLISQNVVANQNQQRQRVLDQQRQLLLQQQQQQQRRRSTQNIQPGQSSAPLADFVLQTLNVIRHQQIQDSYSFLNSDSFHCPPPGFVRPPPGAKLPTQLQSLNSAPAGAPNLRRKSTTLLKADQLKARRRSEVQSEALRHLQERARRKSECPNSLLPAPSPFPNRRASASAVVGDTRASGSRTPSPALGGDNSDNQMSRYRGIKRQYDEYYEREYNDPSPAKRSRANEIPAPRGPNRSNLLPVNIVQERRRRSQGQEEPEYDEQHYLIKDVDVPPSHIAANEEQAITNHIWQHFMEKQQSQEAYQKKMRLREALYTVTKGIFPYCGLYMVGSSMSGFGSVYSDLDMCLMLSHKAIDQKKEATDILALLLKSLKKCSFIKHMELIRARVPILKFRDKIANVECDLNVNNSVGIRNTHLLGAYSRMDWRVRPLVLFTKHWAAFHDINDARKMTISSYSLSMMVLHYLQCGVEPAVLPSLHKLEPDKYNSERDVRTLSLAEELPSFQTRNTDSLFELFLGFLEYYAHRFDFKNDVISVRLGTKVPKQVVVRQGNSGPATQWKFMCIEEPFDLSNTSRSVYNEYMFIRILQVFRVSHRRLYSTRNMLSLFDHPF